MLAAAVFAAAFSSAAASPERYGNEHTITAHDIPADAPQPDHFRVAKVFTGVPAPPDVRSHPRSRLFRTMIRGGAKKGPNFAGHYTLVFWGCGSGCLGLAIVDAISGKVFHPPQLQTFDNENVDWDGLVGPNERLIRFQLDSALIVVPGGINEDARLRGVSYFVWKGERLRRIRFVPKPYE